MTVCVVARLKLGEWIPAQASSVQGLPGHRRRGHRRRRLDHTMVEDCRYVWRWLR